MGTMNSELYTAASGLLAEARRVDLISNNLANLSTTGFRARRTFSAVARSTFPQRAATVRTSRPVALAGSYAVPGSGPRQPTGGGLDVALGANHVLAVDTPAGRRYTRAGALAVSADGVLVDAAGNAILGEGGQAISGLSPGARISADGGVVDRGAEAGRLLVLSDASGILEPAGGNLLIAPRGRDNVLEPVADPDVQPGWLEGSNTNALEELVRLIESQRAFEGYQKLISLTMNEVNRRAVTELAGV
jgi:flagellar basal body rod protein FlgG